MKWQSSYETVPPPQDFAEESNLKRRENARSHSFQENSSIIEGEWPAKSQNSVKQFCGVDS